MPIKRVGRVRDNYTFIVVTRYPLSNKACPVGTDVIALHTVHAYINPLSRNAIGRHPALVSYPDPIRHSSGWITSPPRSVQNVM